MRRPRTRPRKPSVATAQDLLRPFRLEARGRQKNLCFFAFTATPKAQDAGALRDTAGERRARRFVPFHLYSMRQAIEEGFILDVLANYTTYKTFFRIEKAITDDPEYDTGAGAERPSRAS